MSSARDGAREGGTRRRVDRPGRGGGSATAESLQGRDRPTNADAERAVLGSILIKPDVCDDVALVVRPDDFFD